MSPTAIDQSSPSPDTTTIETKGKSSSNPPQKYHEPVQGTIYHGDGREQALLTHLRSLPTLSTKSTSTLSLTDRSDRVLAAIHEFGKEHYLMNVGETKGEQVEELIKGRGARLILELGAYVGYSGIAFSRHLIQSSSTDGCLWPAEWTSDSTEKRAGYISLEKSEVYAETARGAYELAGVGKAVKVLVGSSSTSLRTLRQKLNMPAPLKFDIVFLDHLKLLYTIDLKVMEEEGLIGPGTILVADNVIKPGNPPYLSYVRATPEQKAASLKTPRPSTQPPPETNPTTQEEWEAAYRTGPLPETRWIPTEADGVVADGKPEFVYKSGLGAVGYDPYTAEFDGCEYTEVVG